MQRSDISIHVDQSIHTSGSDRPRPGLSSALCRRRRARRGRRAPTWDGSIRRSTCREKNDMTSPELVSSEEAARLLGIRVATLYSYVSRGLVRAVGTRGRRRLYARADLERLRTRRDARAGLID